MRKRRKDDALFLGGCLLVLVLIVVGIVALVNLVSPKVEVAAACSGQGVAVSAPYAEGPGPHPVEGVSGGRRIRYDCAAEGWWAESVEETELVACVGPAEKYVIETCRYTGGADITRYGYKRQITLVAARTGEIIASETFRGSSPRGCRQTEERSIKKLEGSRSLRADAVCGWLSEYVAPGQEYPSGPDAERPQPEPTVYEPPPTVVTPDPQPPSAIVTPGSEPPVIEVLIADATYWSGPCLTGACPRGWLLGKIPKEGELVEVVATTDEWAQVRWMSSGQTEVIGWVQKRWLRVPTPLPPTPGNGP